jgi:hypothetical protein
MVDGAVPSERLTAVGHAEPASNVRSARGGPNWVYACAIVQLACSLALLVPQLVPIRVVIRSAALGTSLAFLFLAPGTLRSWGAVRLLGLGALIIVTLAAFNPLGGVPLSVVAHWAFYLAVIAPLYWIGRLEIPRGTVARVLLMLWAYHTVGSIVGMLQVYFPGQFLPSVVTVAERQHLMIQLSSGEWILRPTGLSDAAGGAGVEGVYAALFGSGVVLVRPFRFARVAGAFSICIGLMCIYLSEVRACLVMLVVCFIVLTALLSISGRGKHATTFALVVGVTAVVGFFLAGGVGGQMMSARLSSLIASDPGTVYYSSRGHMLEGALTEVLPQYPLGAGLGHWGMINAYFGSAEQEIGAEIQIMGWVLDGGLPLLLVYGAAVVAAILYACRASQLPDNVDATWASIIAAYSVGALALCFSYALFMSTTGLDFWLANALLMQELPLKPKRA